MAMQALPSQRFIRKTELGPNEYRKRFRQIVEAGEFPHQRC